MTTPESVIVGIDLGTTNSLVAAYFNGKVQIIEEDGQSMLPSVVGMSPADKLIVGQTAKNQLAAFPERTIASVKRRMGEAVQLRMADQEYPPQEISAMILRRLKQRAEAALGTSVTRAVITVPAFFDDNQRQATREAGDLAGLKVERIINEPTAASLVYHAGEPHRRHLIVYDLGGGTFDVSIVRIEAGVVEVLSSKGDTHLGGDDFDELLTKFVADSFLSEYNYDLMAESNTRWRVIQACERAKCELSSMTSVKIAEEFIASVNEQPLNLNVQVTRDDYEQLITPLVERTIACVDEAIRDSGLTLAQLDELILVGGSTRTPLVQERLRQEFQREPHCSVNPDYAVALGAATQAAMQQGHSVGPVLIDVATHTLGIECLEGSSSFGIGRPVFSPILRRNSPLPAKHENVYYLESEQQELAEIHVLQGESLQIERNRSLGSFYLEGLSESDDSDGRITVCFELTLDGVLKVTATEAATGITETLKFENALSKMSGEGRQHAEERLQSLFDNSDEMLTPKAELTSGTATIATTATTNVRIDAPSQPESKLDQLVARAKSLRSSLHQADIADVDRLVGMIETARQQHDHAAIPELETDLDDLLFYLTE